MKLDKSQVLLSPEDEDLRLCRFSFAKGYPKVFSDKYLGKEIHKIIGERIGFVSKQGSGLQIDHINRNKLDNRRENLRLISMAANSNNCQKIMQSKGVCWDRFHKRYTARVYMHGKRIFLGYFNSQEEARKVYVEAKNKHLTELGLADLLLKE